MFHENGIIYVVLDAEHDKNIKKIEKFDVLTIFSINLL